MSRQLNRARMLALTAGATLASTRRVGAQATTLRIGAVATETYAEPLYARDAGFYAKAGLNVDITIFTTGGQITNALAGNALDIGMSDVLQLVQAVEHGVPLAFFAGAMEYVTEAPTTVLAVAKNASYQSAKDLEGGTIAVYGLKSLGEMCVREWLTMNGADQAKVRFVEIPPSATAAAIERGTVSAAYVSEPLLVAVRNDIRIVGKPYDACAKRFYINSWFSSRDWLAKNGALAKKIAQIAYQTASWANSNHTESLQILSKYAKFDPDSPTARAMTRAVYAPSFDLHMIQPVLDIGWKYKLTEKHLSASDIVVDV